MVGDDEKRFIYISLGKPFLTATHQVAKINDLRKNICFSKKPPTIYNNRKRLSVSLGRHTVFPLNYH